MVNCGEVITSYFEETLIKPSSNPQWHDRQRHNPLHGSSFLLMLKGIMWAASTIVCPSEVKILIPHVVQRCEYVFTIARRNPWLRTTGLISSRRGFIEYS